MNQKIDSCCIGYFYCSDCYPTDFDAQGLDTEGEKYVNEGMGNEASRGDVDRRVTSGVFFCGL